MGFFVPGELTFQSEEIIKQERQGYGIEKMRGLHFAQLLDIIYEQSWIIDIAVLVPFVTVIHVIMWKLCHNINSLISRVEWWKVALLLCLESLAQRILVAPGDLVSSHSFSSAAGGSKLPVDENMSIRLFVFMWLPGDWGPGNVFPISHSSSHSFNIFIVTWSKRHYDPEKNFKYKTNWLVKLCELTKCVRKMYHSQYRLTVSFCQTLAGGRSSWEERKRLCGQETSAMIKLVLKS